MPQNIETFNYNLNYQTEKERERIKVYNKLPCMHENYQMN